jgi:hypothetical protein
METLLPELLVEQHPAGRPPVERLPVEQHPAEPQAERQAELQAEPEWDRKEPERIQPQEANRVVPNQVLPEPAGMSLAEVVQTAEAAIPAGTRHPAKPQSMTRKVIRERNPIKYLYTGLRRFRISLDFKSRKIWGWRNPCLMINVNYKSSYF